MPRTKQRTPELKDRLLRIAAALVVLLTAGAAPAAGASAVSRHSSSITKTKVVMTPRGFREVHCGVPEYGPAPPCVPTGATELVKMRVRVPTAERITITGDVRVADDGTEGDRGHVQLGFGVSDESPAEVRRRTTVDAGHPTHATSTVSVPVEAGSHLVTMSIRQYRTSGVLTAGPSRLTVVFARAGS